MPNQGDKIGVMPSIMTILLTKSRCKITSIKCKFTLSAFLNKGGIKYLLNRPLIYSNIASYLFIIAKISDDFLCKFQTDIALCL